MIAEYVFAGLIVADRVRGIDWYSRFLGMPPYMLPNDQEAAWQLTATSSLYILVDRARAGGGIATIVVADLEVEIHELRQRGITAGGPVEIQGAGRKAVVVDPFGNALSVVELVGDLDETSRQ